MGIVDATHEDAGRDAEEAAIECGAQDVLVQPDLEDEAGGRFLTDVTDLYSVADALRAAGWAVASAELGYHPKDPVELDGEALQEVEAFLERLEDHDDVQKVHVALK
jgi:transcriptional/translational regulatory protein YebC/TACO1